MQYSIRAAETHKAPKKKLSCGWCSEVVKAFGLSMKRIDINTEKVRKRTRSRTKKILPMVYMRDVTISGDS